jgi:hypothetical protein
MQSIELDIRLQNERTRRYEKNEKLKHSTGAGLHRNGRGFVMTRFLRQRTEFHGDRAKIYVDRYRNASKLDDDHHLDALFPKR